MTPLRLLASMLLLIVAAFAKDVTTQIKVSGMTCAACAVSVQKSLQRVKGVRNAEVSSEKGLATVTYDDAQANEQQLRDAINKTGFNAEPLAQEKK